MSTKNKGHIQQTAAAKAGISERSGCRIEKGEVTPGGIAVRYWRTRKDPFKNIWEKEDLDQVYLLEWQDHKGAIHRYEWINDIRLNGNKSAPLVNFLNTASSGMVIKSPIPTAGSLISGLLTAMLQSLSKPVGPNGKLKMKISIP
ncbi:hypothetical protein [Desulfotignum balticum]|uniref:hypothetical protein n=1 Tax=Desulfotignum balticum TaxID=115781 RepID=UPI001FE239FD|nr:hypothetical protein [Desulfotignum balticum]